MAYKIALTSSGKAAVTASGKLALTTHRCPVCEIGVEEPEFLSVYIADHYPCWPDCHEIPPPTPEGPFAFVKSTGSLNGTYVVEHTGLCMYSSGVLDLTSPLTGVFWIDVTDCTGEPYEYAEFNQIRVELEFGSEFIKVTVFVGATSQKLFEANIDKDSPGCTGPNIYTECPIDMYGWHGGTATV